MEKKYINGLKRAILEPDSAQEFMSSMADLSKFKGYSDSVCPLHVAAACDHLAAAQRLLEKGLDPNTVSPQGTTPLHTAARCQAVAVAELLLARGANRCAVDAASETPLMMAAKLGHSPIVKLLLEDKVAANLEHRDSCGNTALHLAGAGDHEEVVNQLVTWSANVWALNDSGETPLQVAKKHGSQRVCNFLWPRVSGMSWEESEEFLESEQAMDAQSDLVLAVIQNQLQELERAEHKRLAHCSPDGKTLLHWSAISNAAECAEFLLNCGLDVNAVDRTGSSALHYASLNAANRACDLLLKSGADVNRQDLSGLTPLMLCMIAGRESAATRLMETGRVQLDLTDCDGETALMHAARQGSETLARLVIHGSTVMHKNRCGLSALEISEQNGHEKVTLLLEAYRPSLDAYPRRTPKNGYCLVINQMYDTPGLAKNNQIRMNVRKGSAKDVTRIFDLFQGRLNFTVHPKEELTSDEIIQVLRKVSTNLAHIDYFVCIILAHGIGDAILGVDGVPVQIKDIAQQVDAEHCRDLIGKPKIFFIQACRNQLNGAKLRHWQESIQQQQQQQQQPGTQPKAPLDVAQYIDFFFGFSTWEDCESYRIPKEGSIYIQTLCNVIEEDYKRKDLLKMMTRVCHEIGSIAVPGKGSTRYMVPNIKCSLQKDVRF